MTAEEFEEIIAPIMSELQDKIDLVRDDLAHIVKVQCGFFVALGIIAGAILISYLLDRF